MDSAAEFPTADWTVDRYLAWWLEEKSGSLRPQSRPVYDVATRMYGDELAGLAVGEVTRRHLQRIVDAHALRAAPATVRRNLAVVGCALRAAFEDRIITRNPVKGVLPPTIEPMSEPPLDGSAFVRFMRVALAPGGLGGADVLGPAVAFGALTGLRMGEIRGLRWDAIDADLDGDGPERTATGDVPLDMSAHTEIVGVVRVRGQIADRNRSAVLEPLKTPHSRRGVPLTSYALDVLRAQMGRSARRRADGVVVLRRGLTKWEDNDLVFPDGAGRPVSAAMLTGARKRFAAAAGLATAPTFHHLRHAFGSMLLDAGVPLATVTKIMGHSSSAITERYYYQITAAGYARTVEKADAAGERQRFGYDG